MFDDAIRVAISLQARNIQPGDKVGILGLTSREAVTALEGIWLCGAVPIMLSLPQRITSLQDFLESTRSRMKLTSVSLLLLDPDLSPYYEFEPGDPETILLNEVLVSTHAQYQRPPVDMKRLSVLQFTSGSTSLPKGVRIQHAQIVSHIKSISQAAQFDPAIDVVVSWLPLYHDMGFIGLLATPMASGSELVLARPQDFLARPISWMEAISAFKGSISAGPNFSYSLAARALAHVDNLDLSSWRIALNGAETIIPEALENFLEAGGHLNLDPGSAFCAFGMAESTLAVTFPEPGSGMSSMVVDRYRLEHDNVAVAPSQGIDKEWLRRFAKLGTPIPGMEVRIVDTNSNEPVDSNHVGEIEIRGTSVTPGYLDPRDDDKAFHDGWLRTGDLGFISDGELVACGRIKDIIQLDGRSIYPEDIERRAAGVSGVRAGNVIAFSTVTRKGEPEIVVVAETRSESATELSRIRSEIQKDLKYHIGIDLADVALVGPGSIPKTSSGKLQRSLCMRNYVSELLTPL